MRKIFWIGLMTVLGYFGFRYFTKDRTTETPQALAKAFGRALIRNDTVTLETLAQGQAKQDLPRVRSQLAAATGRPVDQLRITSGGGATSSGVMAKNIEIYDDRLSRVMTISAYMVDTPEGWRVERLKAVEH